MVRHVLHHAETLAHVTLDLQVHQNGANETGAHDRHIVWQHNLETVTSNDRADEENHEALEAEDEHSCVVRIVHIVHIEIKLAHDLPVESLECHSISVVSESQLFVLLDNLFQEVRILFLLMIIK